MVKIPIIWINPGADNEPAKLNAIFFDDTGNKIILRIIDNEWIADTDNWDIEVTSGKLSIKDFQNHTNLVLDFRSKFPDVLIEEWNTYILGNRIKCKGDVLNINNHSWSGFLAVGCAVGIQIGTP